MYTRADMFYLRLIDRICLSNKSIDFCEIYSDSSVNYSLIELNLGVLERSWGSITIIILSSCGIKRRAHLFLMAYVMASSMTSFGLNMIGRLIPEILAFKELWKCVYAYFRNSLKAKPITDWKKCLPLIRLKC